MNLRFLKPTRKKIILSFAVLILWYAVLSSFRVLCKCALGGFEGCVDYEYLELIHNNCHCSCTSLSEAVVTNITLILPSIIVYVIYSLLPIFFKKKV